MTKKCNTDCSYFPKQAYANSNYTVDNNGVKHCVVNSRCGWDGHKILKWEECENYHSPHCEDKILVFVGKSSAGKDTCINYLINAYGFIPVISCTTRPKREKEEEGVDYHFKTQQEFLKLISTRKLLEFRTYETLFNDKKETWYYGTPKDELKVLYKKVCAVDLEGLKKIVSFCGKDKVVPVYIDCDINIREQRAVARGTFSKSEWDRRVKDDNTKFTKNIIRKSCKHFIDNNGTLNSLFIKLDKIIREEKLI